MLKHHELFSASITPPRVPANMSNQIAKVVKTSDTWLCYSQWIVPGRNKQGVGTKASGSDK